MSETSRSSRSTPSVERPNDYDWRQMNALRNKLQDALRQVNWMLEEGRTNEDRALRASFARWDAARASRMAKNAQKRFYKHLGWELEEWER